MGGKAESGPHGKPRVIEIRNSHPKNGKHFSRLLKFCREVLAICAELDITPVLTGSLALHPACVT